MSEQLHQTVRAGSQKARIWEICDTLLRERGAVPSGREVVDRYVAEGGNEGTGFTQFSHWKRALSASGGDPEQVGGLADAPVAFEPQAEAQDGYFPLRVTADGSLFVPSALRDAMMLDPDGRVTAHVEDGELRIISPLAAIRRIQRIAQGHRKPGESVVDELIAERRAEAMREDAEP